MTKTAVQYFYGWMSVSLTFTSKHQSIFGEKRLSLCFFHKEFLLYYSFTKKKVVSLGKSDRNLRGRRKFVDKTAIMTFNRGEFCHSAGSIDSQQRQTPWIYCFVIDSIGVYTVGFEWRTHAGSHQPQSVCVLCELAPTLTKNNQALYRSHPWFPEMWK